MQVVREGPLKLIEIGVLAQRWTLVDVDFPSSGKRVSNTWVTYLQVGDNNWKRLIIPNVLYGVKKPLKLRLEMGLRRIS